MSHKLKTALMAAGLTSVLALVSLPTYAVQGQGHGPNGGGMSHEMQRQGAEHGPRDGARMERRMTDLKSTLNLQDKQMAAWSTFESAMKPSMKGEAQTRQQHQEAFKTMTTTQRLDWMTEMKTKRDTEMAQRTEAIKAFYGQLSAEQQKSFDQAFWNHRGDRHGMGDQDNHHGRGEQRQKPMQ